MNKLTNKPLRVVPPPPKPWCSGGGRHEAQHDLGLAFREFFPPFDSATEEALFLLQDATHRLGEAYTEGSDSVRSRMIAYSVQVIAAAARLPLEERLAHLEERLAALEPSTG